MLLVLVLLVLVLLVLVLLVQVLLVLALLVLAACPWIYGSLALPNVGELGVIEGEEWFFEAGLLVERESIRRGLGERGEQQV